jgi:hypothetical protein
MSLRHTTKDENFWELIGSLGNSPHKFPRVPLSSNELFSEGMSHGSIIYPQAIPSLSRKLKGIINTLSTNSK